VYLRKRGIEDKAFGDAVDISSENSRGDDSDEVSEGASGDGAAAGGADSEEIGEDSDDQNDDNSDNQSLESKEPLTITAILQESNQKKRTDRGSSTTPPKVEQKRDKKSTAK